MKDEEKKEKLRKYLIAVDRLQVKCNDAARWESMSFGATGSIRVGQKQNQPDEIKETAIQLRQDCETAACEVRELRIQLDAALACMTTDRLRSLLERKYIEGMPDYKQFVIMDCSKRHFYRLMTQALRELDQCSAFFSFE